MHTLNAVRKPSRGTAHGVVTAVLVGALMALLVVVLVGAPAASARAVDDPDIGWPTALRKQLRLPKVATKECQKEHTRATIRRQNRIHRRDEQRDVLYRIFHRKSERNMWGNMWYAICQRGELQIGVAYAGSARDVRRAVRRARAHLARRKLTRDVRLVAVRSTYRHLEQESDRLWKLIRKRPGSDRISSGISTTRNVLEVEIDHRVPEATRAVLRTFARRSPVAVVLIEEPAPDPNAPIPTYEAWIKLDPAAADRGSQSLTVTVDDMSCAGDEFYDTAERFAGVEVQGVGQAYVLTARLRINPDWPEASTCEGDGDPRLSVQTTVTLPEPLGDNGIVDGAEGAGGFRHVLLPPVGAEAIRSLVPKFIYSGDTCDALDVRRAFKGHLKKTEWCFY